jgi:molybdopterin biosynthesis enzyme
LSRGREQNHAVTATSPSPEFRPSPLTPVEAALAALLESCRPVEPEETPVAEAIGAVLADPLRAPGPVPRRALALRQGWAVNAADIVGASPYAPMPFAGTPAFVQTGDALPPGTDAVLRRTP